MHGTFEDRRLAALYRDSERETAIQVIRPDAEAHWYFVRCVPGREITVMRWLARRRFGVFLPTQANSIRRIIPGWLAVYVWDIYGMHERILDCPGVVGILRTSQNLPVRLSFEFINNLHAVASKAVQGPRPEKRPRNRFKQRDRRKLRRLTKALKRSDAAHALDIRAKIEALRYKLSAPQQGVGRMAA